MINFQRSICINRVKIILSVVSLLLPVLILLCVTPQHLQAQALGTVITFQEIIDTDEEGGRLFFPGFVFVDAFTNEFYLIDGGSRIIIFSPDFFPLYTLSKRDGIETPQGLTVDAKGNVYVAQSPTESNPKSRISVFNACLNWERDIYLKDFKGPDSFVPYRLAIDKKGNIFVASSYYPGVLYIDGSGRLIDIISPEEKDKKAIITNVILDKDGRVYLVSEEEGRIYVYDQDRKFVMKFGEKGGSSGKLSRPRAMGVDNRNGRMFVIDYMRHTVTVYNRDGGFMFEFGGLGWGEGWFQHPIDLAVNNEGRIIVADMFNQRLQVFNSW